VPRPRDGEVVVAPQAGAYHAGDRSRSAGVSSRSHSPGFIAKHPHTPCETRSFRVMPGQAEGRDVLLSSAANYCRAREPPSSRRMLMSREGLCSDPTAYPRKQYTFLHVALTIDRG
jgi:hypothetical protein